MDNVDIIANDAAFYVLVRVVDFFNSDAEFGDLVHHFLDFGFICEYFTVVVAEMDFVKLVHGD